ncbi:hypothetical protein KP509_12G014000 [Ceratopteris richardii]|uniref:Uncharacterized protein n=1 Tax=Ceratopteris richardii TaxID=49495 RepID=A0A8T2TMC2_CERRI|nr:hypothetical protein KP509_12G014000 [Ceratopteris richardii]
MHACIANTLNLQKLSIRVLSQGTYASPCEGNWSTFSLFHTQKKSLPPKNVEKLAYIHTNLCLASKIKERGFVKMEITMNMMEQERHDYRLLRLKETIEDQGSLGARTNPLISYTCRRGF